MIIKKIFCLISEDSRKLLRSLGKIGIIDYEYFNTHSKWGIENYLENREEEKAQWGTVAIVDVRDESMNQWRPGRLSESSHYLKIDPGL